MATQSPATLAAVVVGATGATGSCLVQTLLKAKDKVSKVTILSRRKVESVDGVDVSQEESDGRLVQHVQNLDDVTDEKMKELCTGSHVFFNCLGTTRAAAGSAEAFRHIDHEIPERLSKAAQQAGVSHCSSVSSYGASSSSWFLYMKTKGQLEEAMSGMGFSYTSIFRPGYLNRGRTERLGEKIMSLFTKGLAVSTLAESMFLDAWKYHSEKQMASGAEANTAFFNNTAIRRICEEAQPKAEAAK